MVTITMDASSSQSLTKTRTQKRPDSLKLELLPIPEHCVPATFEQELSNRINVGFKNLSYCVREGVFHRSKCDFLVNFEIFGMC